MLASAVMPARTTEAPAHHEGTLMNAKRSAMYDVLAVVVACSLAGCGAAVDDPSAQAQAADTAPLAARPSALDFGTVAAGATVTQSTALTNVSRANVDVTSVTFVSAFPPDPCRAVLIQPCIRPGESVPLAVTCSPTAAGAFGGRVAVGYVSNGVSYVLSVSVSGAVGR